MQTPAAIAAFLVDKFPLDASMLAQDAICWALEQQGATASHAFTIATETLTRQVLRHLRASAPEKLPFTFSESDDELLVGKQRVRRGDSPRTIELRERLALLTEMVQAIYGLGACLFERLGAAVMVASGAVDAHAPCAGDDGGIDVYARVPIRPPERDVPAALLNTSFLEPCLLALAQCKCYRPDEILSPDVVREFDSAVEMCLRKYENVAHAPTNRIPEEYYLRGETTLRVIFTTADFSVKASDLATALNIILVSGSKLAAFLLARGAGLETDEQGRSTVSTTKLRDWVAQARDRGVTAESR